MGMGDGRAALVEQAYAAALDDALWEPWAYAFLHEFRGRGGLFTVFDDRGPTPERILSLWPDPRIAEEYASGLFPLDPQLPFVSGLTRSTIYLDTDYIDLANPDTRQFMTWIKDYGGVHHMTAVALLGDGTNRAGISVHYGAHDEPSPFVQRERLAVIFSSIGHAFGLAFRHAELLREAYWDGMITLDSSRAALLLDERGRVLRVSAAALRLIDAADGLTLSRQTLGCDRSADAARLGAMLAAAVRPVAPAASALRLQRRSGRTPLLITAYPLVRSRRMLAPLEAAALVTIIDPAATPLVKPTLWRTSFEFTAREAELAKLMVAGHSVESAAATLQMAMPTARTHLRSVFHKTGTDRQSTLLQLLNRVG